MGFTMAKHLQTVDDVIDAFGGHKTAAANNKAVAKWLGLNTSAVCNWRERRNIPSGWHLRFYLEAKERGMEIGATVFGLPVKPGPPVKKKRSARRARDSVEFQAA